ncbi:uncharacterized protein [Epargyreus clarus]|uniref:uncharacterized protein isoform X2 n=1 Tax=Epargyreus clarus TaxID=520877 RepID=UPI003C30AFCC
MGFAVVACVLLLSGLCYGYPGATDGVGAFAYQDSTGNRYGGTYGLKGGQVVNVKGDQPPPGFVPPSFGPPSFGPPNFQDIDDFFPEYFRNFEYLVHHIRVRRFLEPLPPLPPLPPLAPLRMRPFRRFKPLDFGAFGSDTRNLDLALSAAHQAYDLASNRIPYMPNFDFRFPPFGGFPNFVDQGIPMPYGMSDNSAYAGAAAGPGYSQHRAFINPQNPQNPNVDVTKTYSDPGRNGGYYSVSSTSYASSSNVDGQVKSHRGAETKVNNNGEVTHYKVQS